jgi:hypothetical protein
VFAALIAALLGRVGHDRDSSERSDLCTELHE